MSRDEFERAVGPLLGVDPFMPMVITLADGSRRFVDDPGQLHRPPGPAVEVRTRSQTHQLSYEDIVRVEPFDRADDRSMRLADFQTTLRTLYHDPRIPFEVELTDGRRLNFPRGGEVAFNGRHAIVSQAPGEPVVRLTADQVAGIVVHPVLHHA